MISWKASMSTMASTSMVLLTTDVSNTARCCRGASRSSWKIPLARHDNTLAEFPNLPVVIHRKIPLQQASTLLEYQNTRDPLSNISSVARSPEYELRHNSFEAMFVAKLPISDQLIDRSLLLHHCCPLCRRRSSSFHWRPHLTTRESLIWLFTVV